MECRLYQKYFLSYIIKYIKLVALYIKHLSLYIKLATKYKTRHAVYNIRLLELSTAPKGEK